MGRGQFQSGISKIGLTVLPEMRGLCYSCSLVSRVEVNTGIVPLRKEFIGDLGMVVMIGVLVHIGPKEYLLI